MYAHWEGSVSHQIKPRAEKKRQRKMLKTADAVCLQGLLNKCNLVYLTEWSMKDFSPILHNSLWGGPWNNFESTSNNCFAQRVILVSGVTQLQRTTMCSCSDLFDNKQMFICHGKVNVCVTYKFFCFLFFKSSHQFLNSRREIPKTRIFWHLMAFLFALFSHI